MADEKQQLDWDKIKKFSKQVSNDIGAAMLGALSYIGDRLGIFSALAQSRRRHERAARGKDGTQRALSARMAERDDCRRLRELRRRGQDLRDAGRACDGARARRLAVLRRRLYRNDRPADVDRAEGARVIQERARRFAERISARDVGGDGAFVGLDVPASAGSQVAADDAASCREADRRRLVAGRWLWQRACGDRDRVRISQGQSFRLRRAWRLAGARACECESRRTRRQNQV